LGPLNAGGPLYTAQPIATPLDMYVAIMSVWSTVWNGDTANRSSSVHNSLESKPFSAKRSQKAKLVTEDLVNIQYMSINNVMTFSILVNMYITNIYTQLQILNSADTNSQYSGLLQYSANRSTSWHMIYIYKSIDKTATVLLAKKRVQDKRSPKSKQH